MTKYQKLENPATQNQKLWSLPLPNKSPRVILVELKNFPDFEVGVDLTCSFSLYASLEVLGSCYCLPDLVDK